MRKIVGRLSHMVCLLENANELPKFDIHSQKTLFSNSNKIKMSLKLFGFVSCVPITNATTTTTTIKKKTLTRSNLSLFYFKSVNFPLTRTETIHIHKAHIKYFYLPNSNSNNNNTFSLYNRLNTN